MAGLRRALDIGQIKRASYFPAKKPSIMAVSDFAFLEWRALAQPFFRIRYLPVRQLLSSLASTPRGLFWSLSQIGRVAGLFLSCAFLLVLALSWRKRKRPTTGLFLPGTGWAGEDTGHYCF